MQQLKSIVKSSHPAAKLITIQGTAAVAKKKFFITELLCKLFGAAVKPDICTKKGPNSNFLLPVELERLAIS